MTRAIICGGRDYGRVPSGITSEDIPSAERRAAAQWEHFGAEMAKLHAERHFTFIAQGKASGADNMANCWAQRHLIPSRGFQAKWQTGRGAGPIRNDVMLRETQPDVVIAFPGGRGTLDMVRQARAAGVEVIEVPDYDA